MKDPFSKRFASLGTWRQDLLASGVVFLVALPLCMGIAIASGVPPALGLITGIVGGLLVGVLQGAPLQASGPAAGLAVIVWELVQKHGIRMTGIIVLIAGMIQVTAGIAKIGRWFRAVPPSVIHGMLSGIGLLIIASQFHVMLDDKPHGSGLKNFLTIPQTLWKGIVYSQDLPHEEAALIGLVTITLVVIWNRYISKHWKMIPGALVGVAVGTIVANALRLPVAYVAVPNSLLSSVSFPMTDDLQEAVLHASIWGSAAAVALIASAETLLCATAVDRMHHGPKTDYNRELLAQGIGNALCGFLGALPMTGVIVRSTVNIQAGARTRLSAILHGGWILVLVVFFPQVLRLIPVSSLAALLVYTGYKLLNLSVIKQLRRHSRSEVAIYVITTVAIVSTDLLKGVILGIALAIGKLLYRLSQIRVVLEQQLDQNQVIVHIEGAATFLRLPEIAETLESVPIGTKVQVRFGKLQHLDHAILDLLRIWEQQHRANGGEVVIHWEEVEILTN